MDRRWMYGAAMAVSVVVPSVAGAACSVSGAVTLAQCDDTFIDARITPGVSTLTVQGGTVSDGVSFLPLPVIAGAYTSVLTLTGGVTIFRDDYPAVVLNSDPPVGPPPPVTSWNVTVNIDAGVTITTDMASADYQFGSVFVRVDQAGDIVINNAGAVNYFVFDDYNGGAIAGVTDAGDTTIFNAGVVVSEARGLYADTTAGSSFVTNTGTVTAYSEAVRANSGNGNVVLVNSGTLVSETKSATVGWTNSGGVAISNSGTVTSRAAAALLAWSTNGLASVANSGTLYATGDNPVQGSGNDYDHAGIWAYAASSGDVGVLNAAGGRIFAVLGYGIAAIADDGDVGVGNAGLIASAHGISVTADGAADVVNTGTIVATDTNNPTAVSLDVSGIATVTNSGTVLGGIATSGGLANISNSGVWYLLSDQVVDGASMTATSGAWSVAGAVTFDNTGVFGIDRAGANATISGALTFNNLSGATLSVAAGAHLTLVDGDLFNSGTIDMANGVAEDALTIGGTFQSSASAVLKVDVNASGDADSIAVTGDATLGGLVAVTLALGDYSSAQTYTLVSSASLNGSTFAGLGYDYAYFDTSLSYTSSAARLTVARNTVSLVEAVSGGGNAYNTAAALAGLPETDPLAWAALQMTKDEVNDGFGQLSGDAHATVLSGLSADSHYVRDASFNRLRQAFGDIGAGGGQVMGYGEGGPEATTAVTPFAVWTQGFGSVARSEDDNAGRETRRTLGTALGADVFLPFGDQVWRVGVAGSYAASSANVDSRNANADIDGYSAMLYAGTEFGAWALRLGASATWNDIDSARRVAITGFDERLSADYWARTWQAFGEVGYRTKLGGAWAEPFVGLSYVVVDSEDVVESGDTVALAVAGTRQEALYSTAGLRLQQDFGAVTLSGSAAWRHGFGDLTSDVTARFLTGGDSFTVQGVDTGRDMALVSAGAAVKLSETATAGLAYDASFGADGNEHGGRADLRIRF